jgi:hypothetical protein
VIVSKLDEWIGILLHRENLDATCEALATAAEGLRLTTPGSKPQNASWPIAMTG